MEKMKTIDCKLLWELIKIAAGVTGNWLGLWELPSLLSLEEGQSLKKALLKDILTTTQRS